LLEYFYLNSSLKHVSNYCCMSQFSLHRMCWKHRTYFCITYYKPSASNELIYIYWPQFSFGNNTKSKLFFNIFVFL